MDPASLSVEGAGIPRWDTMSSNRDPVGEVDGGAPGIGVWSGCDGTLPGVPLGFATCGCVVG